MKQPLDIAWADAETAVVTKDGVEQGRFTARKSLVTNDRYVQAGGNTKSQGVVGMIKGLSQWCGRSLTGFEHCGVPCYTNPDGSGGCYANFTMHAMPLRKKGFDVIHNGFKPGSEAYGYIQLPKYESYDLAPARARVGKKRMIWRVDSETTDVSASLALGQMQLWAEANPLDWFVSISSNYYHVPQAMLQRAAALPNLVVGHTFSQWFGEDDLANRLHALKRYLKAGVCTQVWLATRMKWGVDSAKQKLIDSAIALVAPTQVIEVPYHDRAVGHLQSSTNINPLGVCCEVKADKEGRRVRDGMVEVDGVKVPVKGPLFDKCKGCKLLCGVAHEVKSRRTQ